MFGRLRPGATGSPSAGGCGVSRLRGLSADGRYPAGRVPDGDGAGKPAFAINVCNTLDKYGINCGTLGLDIGMDPQWNLWLIEINNRDPDPRIAMDIHDVQLYYTLKTGPLFYAKLLAGFKDLNDS